MRGLDGCAKELAMWRCSRRMVSARDAVSLCGSKRLSRARAWCRSDAHHGLLEGGQPGRRVAPHGAEQLSPSSAQAPTDAAAARTRPGCSRLGRDWAQLRALRRACGVRGVQVTDDGDVVLSQGAINGFLGGS
eukprot:scaffold98719_cov45-Phaeocystis_antarctica.AAC.1